MERFESLKRWFNGASVYRFGMFVGAVGVSIFMGIGVYYVVDYFTAYILPYPYNFISSIFVAVFIEYKAVSLFLNGFQAITTIKETHNRRKQEYENRTGIKYTEWAGAWAVYAQFIVVIIMDSAGNMFRIYTAQQDSTRSIGAFIIYECLVFLPFLAGYSIYKQTTRPVEMIEEEYDREYTIKEIEENHKQRTQALAHRSKQIAPPKPITGQFEEIEEAGEEEEPRDFTKARRIK